MLYLYNNQISDIEPLKNLTSLTWLSLYNNQISDIEPLANLKKLEYLWLSKNKEINKQLPELEKALPKCKIEIVD